jgi:predicted nucleic acid-binding Zn ribbon protein
MTAPERADPRPPRHCYKCGREIGPDESICEVCNRAGMATPSASQYHGTIVVAIVAGVALLAIAASLAMRGIGPYTAHAVSFSDQGTQVVASVAVTNEGTKRGRAKCQVVALDSAGDRLGSVSAVTPEVAGGATVTFPQAIPGVSGETDSVSVACQ